MSAGIATLAARIVGKPLRRRIIIMAKARVSINPMYKGGAGGYTFYVRGGEQVVRQRRNNSNYGESASRTQAQMIRRIKWGNLVNIYKAIKSWQQKAYDSKSIGQTDYNIFMKLNIPMASVGVTKAACEQGFAVFENYRVSKGSLPPVNYNLDVASHRFVTDIVITIGITAETTVGELSAEIIAKNPQYQAGDNIAFVFVRNHQWTGAEWPFAYSVYTELTLDASDTRLVDDIPELGSRLTESANDTLDVLYTAPSGQDAPVVEGLAIIHTRKVAGQLFVSSQNIIMESDQFIQRYSGEEWYQHCIDSYGITDEVPLDPSFLEAPIQSVTANGEPIQNAAVLTGSQVIKLVGENIDESLLSFDFNGVEYTPLIREEGSLGYIIGDNGSAVIRYAGQTFFSFRVEGVVVPPLLPTEIKIRQSQSGTSSGGEFIHPVTANTKCVQYPYLRDDDYPYYRLQLAHTGVTVEDTDFEFHNCTATANEDYQDTYWILNCSINNADEAAWITYKGFIIAVFNYTN